MIRQPFTFCSHRLSAFLAGWIQSDNENNNCLMSCVGQVNTFCVDLQECCDCCSLGLQIRREGYRCEAHHYFGFQCKHAFMSCCVGEGYEDGSKDQWNSPVREKPVLASTPPPQRGTLKCVQQNFKQYIYNVGRQVECFLNPMNLSHASCL